MRRNAHIIQITGFRGILMAVFVVSCLAAGFIGFPALVAMHLWNYATNFVAIPAISFVQGLMLWSIVAIIGYIINDRKKYLVALNPKSQLSEEEINKIMERVRLQRNAEILNSMILNNSQEQTKSEKEDSKDKENV